MPLSNMHNRQTVLLYLPTQVLFRLEENFPRVVGQNSCTNSLNVPLALASGNIEGVGKLNSLLVGPVINVDRLKRTKKVVYTW